jgi:hypothetical protein
MTFTKMLSKSRNPQLEYEFIIKTIIKLLQFKKAGKKNVKFDAFGSKVAKIHTGRQQVEKIQTRKTKVFKNSNRI